MFLITEEAKETVLDFFQETVKVLQFYFVFVQYQYKITQYNFLNVRLSTLQLNKLNSGIKNGTEVSLKLSSNVAGVSNDENNFPRK